MGFLDQLGQAAAGMMGGGDKQNPLIQAVIGLLGQNSSVGGLGGLVQAFQKNGLGEIVNSWVGTGKNLPISADQIQQGLGGDLLKQLAARRATAKWVGLVTTTAARRTSFSMRRRAISR